MKLTKQQLAQKYYKQYIEDIPLTQDIVIESFLEGFNSAEKRIKDRINALKSKLAEEKIKKTDKRINTEKIKELEIQINLLKELL